MAHRNLGGNPNIIRAGAFEAKFVALRQVCRRLGIFISAIYLLLATCMLAP